MQLHFSVSIKNIISSLLGRIARSFPLDTFLKNLCRDVRQQLGSTALHGPKRYSMLHSSIWEPNSYTPVTREHITLKT